MLVSCNQEDGDYGESSGSDTINNDTSHPREDASLPGTLPATEPHTRRYAD